MPKGRLGAGPELLMFISTWVRGPARHKKVPVITVGGLGGTLENGEALDYLEAGDDHRKWCSLYLGIMDRMACTLDHSAMRSPIGWSLTERLQA